MATRQLMHISKVTKAHINSVDGSSAYETNTKYEAGTLVTDDNKIYVSIKDLTASQVGVSVPLDKPDMWAEVTGQP